MNIFHLLDELPVAPDVEILVAFLPKVLGIADEPAGDALF